MKTSSFATVTKVQLAAASILSLRSDTCIVTRVPFSCVLYNRIWTLPMCIWRVSVYY
jgi:hypothetical protein